MWRKTLQTMVAKKSMLLVMYVALFVASFSFFLYFTFPFEVLKENVASEMSKATGLSVRIGRLGPSFPLGLEAERVEISRPTGGSSISFPSMRVSVGLFSLLILNINPEINLTMGKGELDAEVSLGLFDIIRGKPMPKRVRLVSRALPLEGLTAFALESLAVTADPLLAPVLKAVSLRGKLEADIDARLGSEPAQANGKIDIAFKDAALTFDPGMDIPDQFFKVAAVKAPLRNGELTIEPPSGLDAEDIHVDLSGTIKTQGQMDKSPISITIATKVKGKLLEKIGLLIGESGEVNVQLRGTLGEIAMTKS